LRLTIFGRNKDRGLSEETEVGSKCFELLEFIELLGFKVEGKEDKHLLNNHGATEIAL